jgi:gliding motility-associated-like protein
MKRSIQLGISFLFILLQISTFGQITIISDGSWKVETQLISGWATETFNDASWVLATSPATKPGIAPIVPGSKSMWWKNTNPRNAYFRKTFNLSKPVKSAVAEVCVDNEFNLYVNGNFVGNGTNLRNIYKYDIAPYLVCGKNVIALHGIELVPTTPSVASFKAVIDTIVKPLLNLRKDTTVCNGAKILLDTKLSGFKHIWSTTETTTSIWISSAGKYWLTVEKNGCKSSDSINVIMSTLAKPKLGNDTSLCQGQFLTLDGKTSGANSYSWNTGNKTSTLNIANGGTFILTVFENQCKMSDTINVKYSLYPKIDLGPDTAFCGNFILTLDAANSGYQYYWNTGATTQKINVSQHDLYWVEVNNSGCKTSDTINIKKLPGPFIFLGNDTLYCNSFQRIFKARNPGATYLWNTGSTLDSIIINSAGKYWVDITLGSCIITDTINLYDSSFKFKLPNDTNLCFGQNLTLYGKTGYTNQWNTGQKSDTLLVTQSGLYSIKVSNGKCQQTDSVLIFIRPPLKPNLGPDHYICNDFDETVTLKGPAGYKNYIWQPDGDTMAEVIKGTIGIFTLKIRDQYNCEGMDTLVINRKCPIKLWVPTAFSPNNSGPNNQFNVVYDGPPVVDYKMRIFNRWGELLFESSDINSFWDGTYMGKACQVDVYLCVVNFIAKYPNESILKTYKGGVHLIR